MQKLLLASSSIYRQELLSRLQIPFGCFSPDIDETPKNGESIEALVLRLSKEKAKAALNQYPDAICIGSDELAVLNKEVLGKPLTHENAIQQLSAMSGQKVDFYTGICVLSSAPAFEDCRLVTTSVTFRKLTPSMIENYLQKEKPYQSAGSFKSETLGSALIEKFHGDDPTAIIGLPLITLCNMLEKVGMAVI
ncbi:MAG TPA: Maf family nucleotide pyrophosphatase [Candidatus Berkiella sp.]|nr:Maf family nucleotide pyrophosphatase [Candidatus Berkiella sp.]